MIVAGLDGDYLRYVKVLSSVACLIYKSFIVALMARNVVAEGALVL